MTSLENSLVQALLSVYFTGMYKHNNTVCISTHEHVQIDTSKILTPKMFLRLKVIREKINSFHQDNPSQYAVRQIVRSLCVGEWEKM